MGICLKLTFLEILKSGAGCVILVGLGVQMMQRHPAG